MSCGRESLLTKRMRDPLGTVSVRGETPAAVTVNTNVLPPFPDPGDGLGLDGDDPPQVDAIIVATRRPLSAAKRRSLRMTRHYNRRMTASKTERRTFSLDAAVQLLPSVKLVTAEAVREAESIAEAMRSHGESDPRRQALSDELSAVVRRWASRIEELQLEPKGLWLVDFDNGEGYYCWQYPEDAITHFHGYDDGFAGRMKIV
jgi:hypothetical protein